MFSHADSAGAAIIMTCVGNDNDLRSIVYGDDGILAGMKKGAVYCDHTTASAIVADLITFAERRQAGLGPGGAPLAPLPPADLKAVDDIRTGCYCRFTVHDKPGVLAQISTLFAEGHISIETVIQHGRSETDAVPLIMITHEAPEAAMRQAIARIDSLPTVTEKPQIIRILNP